MEISVSILKEKDNIEEAVKKLNKTDCDYIHLDIMDGTFTEESSFEISEFFTINTRKKLDVHIMSKNLDYQVKEALKLNPEMITIHYEATPYISKYIKLIKSRNIKVGLAINPDTNFEDIKNYINEIDLVLVMSVVPGAGGQKFIESTVDKLKKIDSERSYLVSVDGGINKDTIKNVSKYVDIAVSGSFITNSDDYQKQIDLLR